MAPFIRLLACQWWEKNPFRCSYSWAVLLPKLASLNVTWGKTLRLLQGLALEMGHPGSALLAKLHPDMTFHCILYFFPVCFGFILNSTLSCCFTTAYFKLTTLLSILLLFSPARIFPPHLSKAAQGCFDFNFKFSLEVKKWFPRNCIEGGSDHWPLCCPLPSSTPLGLNNLFLLRHVVAWASLFPWTHSLETIPLHIWEQISLN